MNKEYFVGGDLEDKIKISTSGCPDHFDHLDVPQPYILISQIVGEKQYPGVWLCEKQALKLIKTIEKALVRANKSAMKVRLKRFRDEQIAAR